MSERVGYGRVSARDRDPDSERDALIEAGCVKLFVEKVSSRLDERPELRRALEYASKRRVRDHPVRPGRVEPREMIALVDTLSGRGVDLIVLEQDIDTTTPQGGRCSRRSPRSPSSCAT